jgi:hypothetical protein
MRTFSHGLSKTAGIFSKLKAAVIPAAAKETSQSLRAARVALKERPIGGYAAIDADKINRDFNLSGYLRGTSKPASK